MAEIIAVVLLSTLFETWEHSLRHRFAHQGRTSELRILEAFFKEVTCLGFIGLLLYLVHRLNIVDELAGKLFPAEELEDENPLFETFELVHMMVFMLLLVLLFQAAALLPMSRRIIHIWRRFERTKAWGNHNSLESMFVQAGYLQRLSCKMSPRGLQLAYVKPFTHGCTLLERVRLRRDPLHSLISWRALRHDFLFPSEMTIEQKRESYSVRRKGVKIVPNPGLFSFEGYLRGILSNTCVAFVELDIPTWSLTLLVLMPLVYAGLFLSCSIEFLQCSAAWLLFAGAGAVLLCLEEDIHMLTPRLPEDARQILRLFSGTSIQDFQRQCAPSNDPACHDVHFGAPGLGGLERSPKLSITGPTEDTAEKAILSCEGYRHACRIVGFWQAICVTSLMVSFLSHPIHGWAAVTMHCLAWAEWPLMLFWLWPLLVRRLTMRDSMDTIKDSGLIRSVTLHCKEGLLRHHLRLVQVMGHFGRAQSRGEVWARSRLNGMVKDPRVPTSPQNATPRSVWTQAEAHDVLRRGLHGFAGLSLDEQAEIWELFESLDTDNSGSVDTDEFLGKFTGLGFTESKANEASEGILRLFGCDDSQCFNWEQFKALIAVATTSRPGSELEEDLDMVFTLIAKDKLLDKAGQKLCKAAQTVTVFEVTEWMRGIKRSLTEADVAAALHKHFGEAKPTLTRDEFVDWFQAIALGGDQH